jgi:hypothetical protein
MAFTKFTMEISKKDNGKHKKVGEQIIHVPVLKDIIPFITSDIKKDEKGVEVFEEGLPVYESKEANWLQGAILAAVKAQARNKMVAGTANLKDNAKIAEDWESLTAEGVRDGSGLALVREFKEAFKDWLAKQGISDGAQAVLNTLVGNRPALALQQQSTKDKVRARLEKFVEEMDADVVEKLMRPIEAALEATNASEDPLAGI